MTRRLRILLLDPSEIVTKGLAEILEQSSRYYVTCGHDISSAVGASHYDLVIVNPVLVPFDAQMSGYFMPGTVLMALNYLSYDDSKLLQFDSSISLTEAPDRIMRKVSDVLESVSKEDKLSQQGLSSREKEILVAVAKGQTNKEIADEFSLSINTVMTHRKNISRKTGINSISGLTVYAIMNKLVDMNDLK